ncbi:MAG: YdbH domain-containing protein [Pseudomonadota bacterium]
MDDVSVGSIQAERIDFAAITLRRGDGIRILIESVSLPLSMRGATGLDIDIERIEIELPDSEPSEANISAAVDVVDIVDRIIALPELLPGTRIGVSSLQVSGYPEATGIEWRSGERQQTLTASLEGYRLHAEITAVDAERSSSRLEVRSVNGQPAAEALPTLLRTADGYEIEAALSLDTARLLPALVRAGLLPPEVARLNAALAGEISLRVPVGAAPRIEVAAKIAPRETAELVYQADGDTAARISVLEASAAEVTFGYPSLDWQVAVSDARLQLGHATIPDLGLHVRDVVCKPGIRCTLGADLEPVRVGPGIGLSASAGGLELLAGDGSFTATIAEAYMDVDDITGPAEFEAALSIHAKSVTIDGPDSIRAELAIPSASVRLLGHAIDIPQGRGTFRRDADELTLELNVGASGSALAADISVAHNLGTAATRLTVDDARLDFSVQTLSALVEQWPNEWDLVAGSWRGNAEALRRRNGDIEVSVSQSLHAVDGRYRDIAFAGLSASLVTSETAWPPAEPQEVSVSLDLLDVGFPVRDLEADLSVDAASELIAIDRVLMQTLGGSVAVDPFVLDSSGVGSADGTLRVVLRPESVQLPLMAELANLQALDVLGSVSGVLPVTIGENGVTVENGRLTGDLPGGTIRYAANGCTDEVMRARSGLDYARCVLTYYEFDSLRSDVSYSEDGNLVIEMRLEGVNPEYDPDQPVNLNPTLTTNVIDLIKSLQAARSIEDVFDRQAN